MNPKYFLPYISDASDFGNLFLNVHVAIIPTQASRDPSVSKTLFPGKLCAIFHPAYAVRVLSLLHYFKTLLERIKQTPYSVLYRTIVLYIFFVRDRCST